MGDIYLDPYISSFFRSVKPHSFEVIFVFDLRNLNPTVNDDFSRRFQLGELFNINNPSLVNRIYINDSKSRLLYFILSIKTSQDKN